MRAGLALALMGLGLAAAAGATTPPPGRSQARPAAAPPVIAAPVVAAPAARPPAPPPPTVAIYAALPPSAAYGISQGSADRLMIHVQAEMQCRTAPRSDTCRQMLEIAQGCGALAHGSRDPRLVPIPYNPSIPVSVKTTGTGPTRDQAEREAVSTCQQRDRGATCLVVAATCIGGTPFMR